MATEYAAARFRMYCDGVVDIDGEWPARMRVSDRFLREADPRRVRIEGRHLVLTVASGSARYLLTGFERFGEGLVLLADRVDVD